MKIKNMFCIYMLLALVKACFTLALRQSCTCLRQQISGFRSTAWFLTRSDTNQAVHPQKMARGLKLQILKVEGLYCEQHRKTALRKNKFPWLPQRQKLSFRHVFFAIFVRFLEDARQLQDKQGCHKTAARQARCSCD